MKRKFDDGERDIVVQLYSQNELAVDQLPYTEAFEQMHEGFCEATGYTIEKAHFFRLLTNLRKTKGGLPRKAK